MKLSVMGGRLRSAHRLLRHLALEQKIHIDGATAASLLGVIEHRLKLDAARHIIPGTAVDAAAALRRALGELGYPTPPSRALDMVAWTLGYPNWDTLFDKFASEIENGNPSSPMVRKPDPLAPIALDVACAA